VKLDHYSPAATRASGLSADEVHVWKVSVDRLSTAEDWSLLTQEERDRALALRSSWDRVRWVRAHAALRDVLRLYIGDDLPLRFSVGRFGKPQIEESCGLKFNLAHSGQWALIAIARDREVGVDVEEIRDVDVGSIIRTRLSAREGAALSQLIGRARLDAFYRCWTRKEAFVKALGLGLNADLTAFDVSVDAQTPRLLDMRTPLPRDSGWVLADIMLDFRHKAAIVVQGDAGMECRLLDWYPRYGGLRG
jgi:4'-phosphopantetheinyl transferase